ncbi:MAG: tRNA (5-methylaminomethyl-2-thiouridylate)-methyltransferase [Candidatus Syntrophosphaera sp.]
MTKDHSALALFSGGLDSILAVVWMRELGCEVHPVFFSAPYIHPERAIRSAAENGLKLTVMDISQKHLAMLRDPVYGYGKNVNPCIDCHALMFREAGALLGKFKADFLISGEVVGQRPMSQRRNALQAVDKHSGYGDLIIRPLSQKLLPDTKPIREGWVDKSKMLAIHGRGRKRQIDLANKFGISYPPPGGGCLLTDRNFSLRLRELIKHGQDTEVNIRLLRWGRHFRLEDGTKLIVGRTESDNQGLEAEVFPGLYFKIRDQEGPLGLLTDPNPSPKTIRQAASIVLAYCSKADSPAYVKYGVDRNFACQICVEKCPDSMLRHFMISLDKEL